MMEIEHLNESHLRGRSKGFGKDHPKEVAQLFDNFFKAMAFFESSNANMLRTKSGLVRRESAGILAVDQTGCKKKPQFPLRMYFFVTDEPKCCYLLTIGDKRTQQADNNLCKGWLKKRGLISKNR